jgi:RHS repeat-associated protein
LKINNFGYLNREFQVETGYTDLVNRQFDNIIGRFTSQDPVIEGQEHLSLYQYGWNNPFSACVGVPFGCRRWYFLPTTLAEARL